MIVLAAPVLGFLGGVERHVHDLSVGLRSRGHRVALAYGEARGQDVELYREAFDQVVALSGIGQLAAAADCIYAHKLHDDAVLSLACSRKRVVVAVHDHDMTCVRSHRYLPVTHEPCNRPPGIGCVAHGCIAVRTRDQLIPFSIRNPFRLARTTRAVSDKALLIAGSSFLRRTLLDAGVPPDRVVVIHPVPPDDATPLVAAPTAPVAVFAGQLIRGKGLDILLRAVQKLDPVRVIVAGAGSGRGDSERLCVRLGIQSRVEFLGPVGPEAMASVYDRGRVAVVPSLWPEPFGMVGIEAMRRARPVVGARHGGIPEWLTHGVTGWTFDPGSDASLAQALRRAMDADDYARVAQEARRQASERFSFARMLDEVERCILGAESGPRAERAGASGRGIDGRELMRPE
ncbi:MAG: glycosyltransferase [Deltaproteobacteria bacterium]|nr:glycosyltransferase [Deltaproteobacteria bacterium]